MTESLEEIFNKCSKYKINGVLIELVTESIGFDEDQEIKNTCAIIDNEIYHFIGNEDDDICSAIIAYETFFDVKLTDSEVISLYDEYIENSLEDNINEGLF